MKTDTRLNRMKGIDFQSEADYHQQQGGDQRREGGGGPAALLVSLTGWSVRGGRETRGKEKGAPRGSAAFSWQARGTGPLPASFSGEGIASQGSSMGLAWCRQSSSPPLTGMALPHCGCIPSSPGGALEQWRPSLSVRRGRGARLQGGEPMGLVRCLGRVAKHA